MKCAAPLRRCEKRELFFFGLTRSVADTVVVTERQAIPKLFLMIRKARFWTFQIVFSRETESQSDWVVLQTGLTLYEQSFVNDPIQPDRPGQPISWA
jgi:hypothetical protein